MGAACYCPGRFIVTSSWHGNCHDSFGEIWPDSVGKEDVEMRSCNTSKAVPADSGKSCCAMTEDEISALRGTSENCPSIFSSVLTLSDKCQLCPGGTCRLGRKCYCPGRFLYTTSLHVDCQGSFGESWPNSFRKEDVDYRSCAENASLITSSSASCCGISRPELKAMRGLSHLCPYETYVNIFGLRKCDRCPAGTCRINVSCYCPGTFLSSNTIQGDCIDSFGSSWPLSLHEEDMNWKSCKDLSKPIIIGGNSSSTNAPSTTKAETATTTGTTTTSISATSSGSTMSGATRTASSSTDKMITNTVTERGVTTDALTTKTKTTVDRTTVPKGTTASSGESNVTNTGGPEGNLTETEGDRNEEDEGLSTLEVVGIVVGVITSVVGLVIGTIGFVREYRKGQGRVSLRNEG